MRAYRVEPTDPAVARPVFAGTQADATTAVKALMAKHGLKRKEIDVVDAEIPTDKAGLLAFINQLT